MMSKGPGNPYHDKDGKFASGPDDGAKNPRRWGRMNSTEKAALTSKARFVTKLVGPSKNSKGRAVGLDVARVKGDEKFFINPTGRKGGSFPVYKYEDSKQAVAIKTAKALDRDFHSARKKADQTAMHAALAKSNVPVVKYPSKKPKR